MKKWEFNDDIPAEEAVGLIRAVERYMNSSNDGGYMSTAENTILAILGIERVGEIESIPNYDDRKTTPPDEPEAKGHCNICGQPFWEGDVIYTVDGCVCETCLKENYREFA